MLSLIACSFFLTNDWGMKDVEKSVASIIERLKAIREGKGLSQLELSLVSGISQTAISQMETGKKSPTLATFLRLCDALEISPESVLERSLDDDEKRKRDKQTALEIIEKWM